jgi:hypothetical protein
MPTMIAPQPTPVRPSSSAVEVDVQLQPLDLYRAERTIVWRQVRLLLLVSAIFVLMRTLIVGGLFLLLPVAMIGLFLFVVHSAFIYMASRSTLKTNRMLSGPMHYSFEPGGMVLRGATYWGWQDWTNLHETLETRHEFILRASSAQKNIIPKRCLAPGDLERLRALARPGAPRIPGSEPQAKQVNTSGLVVRVHMTADDLYRGFLTLLLRKSYWYAAQTVFTFILIFALNPRWLSPVAFIVVGSIFIFYFAIYLYWASARAIRTNAAYQNELEFAFDETGLDTSGLTFSNHHDWCNFQSVIEDSKIFLLCPSNSQMVIVPQRCFANNTQIEALRQILRTHFHGRLSLKR